MRAALAGLLLLGGCGQPAPREDAAGQALEQAAIATGTIRDVDGGAIAGLYARDTDRLCIASGRIGVSIDYGGQQGCSARGTVQQRGDTLQLRFEDAPDCRFDARLDQDRIVFPGRVPDACARLCSSRASLAALEVDLLSEAPAEAAALHDAKGRMLCGR